MRRRPRRRGSNIATRCWTSSSWTPRSASWSSARARWRVQRVNVTHPCKQDVVAHLDELSPEAAALEAVNTVVFDGRRARSATTPTRAGSRRASGAGCRTRALDRVVRARRGRGGRRGGACGAELGARRADDRRRRRRARAGAGRAARRAGRHASTRRADADGLIHATPTGMAAHPGLPLPEELLRPELWVAEVVYRPLETELLRARASAAAARSTAAAWRSCRPRARSSCSPASRPTPSGCSPPRRADRAGGRR